MPQIDRNDDDTCVTYSAEEVESFKGNLDHSNIPAGSICFTFSNATGELIETLGAQVKIGEKTVGDDDDETPEPAVTANHFGQYTGPDLDQLASDAKQLTGL